MQVWGIEERDAERVAILWDVDIDARAANARSIYVKASPRRGTTHFRRTSNTGRKVNGLCTHGFEAVIRELFRQGATRVKTPSGDWRSVEEFAADIPRINASNIGSQANPMTLLESCSHD